MQNGDKEQETIRKILLHAKQGQLNPGFAKDYCWEIQQLAEKLLKPEGINK